LTLLKLIGFVLIPHSKNVLSDLDFPNNTFKRLVSELHVLIEKYC
jgi:hypothetical protein